MAEGESAATLHDPRRGPEHRDQRQSLRPIVRRATKVDLDAYYGPEPDRPTISAVVGELDGKLIGCGGFAHVKGILVAFCDLKDEARKFRVQLVREARKLVAEMAATGKVIYATADMSEPHVEHWLRVMGFEPVEGIQNRWRVSLR
jgi:hypothetical protein